MFPLEPIFQSDPREDTSFISYTNTQPTDPAIGSIDAPTASNVWKMQVEAGQTLSSGQTVAILEAMKMCSQAKSSRLATVLSCSESTKLT
jgi:biotin carboxyl carrier protein